MQTGTETRFLADLDAQLRAIDDRETALEVKYKAEKEEIAAAREGIANARKYFLAYLRRTQGATAEDGGKQHQGEEIDLPSRIGEQHHLMLNVLYYSHSSLTARAIAEKAGMEPKVVYTFASRDINDGILEKTENGFAMTKAGRDYMIRLTQKFGAPKQPKAPPAEAGGALQ